MLKLKLQYFGHLMWRADSFEKRKPGEGHSTDSFYALLSFLVKLQQQSKFNSPPTTGE